MNNAFAVTVLAAALASPLAAPQAPPTVAGFLHNLYRVAHNNEICGNIVTTMRSKSVVPPSPEPRPQQPPQPR